MDNPETQATFSTRHRTKTNKTKQKSQQRKLKQNEPLGAVMVIIVW
jgi:hypothetical protein